MGIQEPMEEGTLGRVKVNAYLKDSLDDTQCLVLN